MDLRADEPVDLFDVQSSDVALTPRRRFSDLPRNLELHRAGRGLAVVGPPTAPSFDASKLPLAFAFVYFADPHEVFSAAMELVYSELAKAALQTSGCVSD